jgi:DNA ligase-1
MNSPMLDKFKPMLACNQPLELSSIVYPVVVSPKLDGIRAVVKDSVVLSRTLKPIPNEYIQSILGKVWYNGMDGELIVGDPKSPSCYRDTCSFVMSRDKEGDFSYFAFDRWDDSSTYAERHRRLSLMNALDPDQNTIVLNSMIVNDEIDLLNLEESYVEMGYEGLIIRKMDSPYKFGRVTNKEGYLLKLKRYLDSEALIVGFIEEMHNGNEAETNELGRTKRSTHMANLEGKDTLGALVVRDLSSDVEFNIGTGFIAKERQQIWNQRNSLLNAIVKYKYFPVGIKSKPRHPVFLGFRSEIDL